MTSEQELPLSKEPIDAKTILVLEDDPGIGSFLIQAISQETAYQGLLVTNGFQALKVVRDIKPDLLILDYQLPNMNGIEVYDQVCAERNWGIIPTIMLSAQLPIKEIDKRKIVGMKKPIELNEFLNAIEKLLT